MSKRIVLLVAGWLAGAAAAATGVTLALGVLGSGLFGTASRPLSEAQVTQQLAQAGPEPSAAAAGPPQPTDRDAQPGVKWTPGGSVVVRCTSRGAVLMTTPQQGFSADDTVAGPAQVVSVTLRSDSAEVRVSANCATGQPRFTVSSEPRGGHGGGTPTGQTTVPASGGGGDDGGGHGGGGDNGGGGSNGSPGGSGGTSGGGDDGGGGSGGSGGSGGDG
jgi:hypothetical protein